MSLGSKHPEASFSPTLTDSLYFRVTEVPKSQDLVIFFLDDDNNNDTTDCFIPSACMWGKKKARNGPGGNYYTYKANNCCLHDYKW